MAKGVKGKVTASADGGRSGPVTLVDALKRLLPHCEDNPHKVANWLNERHSEGDIRLLANGVAMAPGSNPSMLGIVAHVPQVGSAVLYVQVRHGRIDSPDGCAYWQPDRSMELLEQHRLFWTFDRASFEKHFPGPAKDPGGRPGYDHDRVLIEGAAIVAESGLPRSKTGKPTLEAFAQEVAVRLGEDSPGDTVLKEILGPLHLRLKTILAL
jgi:hypothetical protein